MALTSVLLSLLVAIGLFSPGTVGAITITDDVHKLAAQATQTFVVSVGSGTVTIEAIFTPTTNGLLSGSFTSLDGATRVGNDGDGGIGSGNHFRTDGGGPEGFDVEVRLMDHTPNVDLASVEFAFTSLGVRGLGGSGDFQWTSSAQATRTVATGGAEADQTLDSASNSHQLTAASPYQGSLVLTSGLIQLSKLTDSGGIVFDVSFATEAITVPITGAGLIINEIHYEPESKTAQLEYVELYNDTSNTIALSGMYFSDGIDYAFPLDSSIGSGAYIILAENKAAFDAQFDQGGASVAVAAFDEYSGKLSNSGEKLQLIDSTGAVVDSVEYQSQFPWPVGAEGQGRPMELINPELDNDLGGSWRAGAGTTPGRPNTIYSANAPPQTRQVTHSPTAPASSDTTLITAKVTDPDGVASVEGFYQTVAAGSYIPAFFALDHNSLLATPNSDFQPNPAFENPANWTSFEMRDDGTGGDVNAGDSVFSASIPAQPHRTLVRYRIAVTDTEGESVRVPYADDPSLNFAFFVYDGLPDYSTSNSVLGGTHVYSSTALDTLPVYHLLTRASDLEECYAWDGALRIPVGNVDARGRENWEAALIYDGQVYDHVRYRLRQRNDRYNLAEHGFTGGGKRSFKIRFQRGRFFEVRDENGNGYDKPWKSISLQKGNCRNTATTSQRYRNFGLWEAANSKLWNLVGVPTPRMFPIHLRIVDEIDETGQFGGDFWGTFLATEIYDSRFVDNHDLPDGNLYKLKDGVSTNATSLKRNQGRDAVTTDADYQNIRLNLRPTRSDLWLDQNVNYERWYLYNAIAQAIGHDDYTINHTHPKNRAWFFEPHPDNPLGYGRLWTLPHDHDATWGPRWNGGDDYSYNAIYGSGGKPAFKLEHRNTIREVLDLVWNADTLHPIIETLAQKLGSDLANADRDRWKNVPTHSSGAKVAFDNDVTLAAVVADMKKFALDGGSLSSLGGLNISSGGRDGHLANLASDAAVPSKPTISYVGDAGFPITGLVFESSAYSDPQGTGTFGSMEWRVAEITPTGGGTATVMPGGANWRFLDDGSNQGTAWRETGFDDSSWATGDSPAGYGDITALTFATPIEFGADSNDKHITTYFRTWVDVPDPAHFDYVTFNLLADDGAVVYVNGTEAFRDGFSPGVNVLYDTVSEQNADENSFDPFVAPADAFVSGSNLVAIEIHQRASNSSDAGFEMTLSGTEHLLPGGDSRNFEWDADWESGELGSFASQATVPASLLREGNTYRARVRHEDDTGRWSHWSDPVEFTAGAPDIATFTASLVVSEIMYHPEDPNAGEIAAGFTDDDSFEYVEIRNVGDQTIDLGDIRFTKGIDFDFAGSAVTSLSPGDFVLVVADIAAFEMRYGAGKPVAGSWSGKLDNGGERLKLSFGAGAAIRDFNYDDTSPWPTSPDGGGFSLVLVDPFGLPDHGAALHWRASVATLGTPGSTDGVTFSGGDADALLAYATGSGEQRIAILADGTITFTVSSNLLAEDIAVRVEMSSDLVAWQSATALLTRTAVSSTVGGLAEITYQTNTPPADLRRFLRYAIELR